MKYQHANTIYRATTAALLLAVTSMAGAHTTGNQSLGTGATAADIFTVSCQNEEGGDTPTYRLSARVKDNSPVRAPIVRVTIRKGTLSAFSEDTNGDGNASYSGYKSVVGGNGVYTVTIGKSAYAAENYISEMHCEGPQSSGFIHTATRVTQTQNQ